MDVSVLLVQMSLDQRAILIYALRLMQEIDNGLMSFWMKLKKKILR